MRLRLLLIYVLLSLALFSQGCALGEKLSPDAFETLPKGRLPSFALDKGQEVAEAYRFALENSQVLEYIPCYCGCVNLGQTSNEACYIKSRNGDGSTTFTSHAAT